MNAREAQVLAELQAHAAEIEVLYGVAGVRGIAEVTALIARLQAENASSKTLWASLYNVLIPSNRRTEIDAAS